MGDGIFDHLIMKKSFYSIAPETFKLDHVKREASYVTKNRPAERAVAEAVIHIIKKFLGLIFLK